MSSAGDRPLLALLVLALLSGAAGYGLGARGEAPEPLSPTWLATLDDALELTSEQLTDIDRLLAAEDADLAALVEAQRDTIRDQVAARRQQTEDAMLAVLDDAQRARYAALQRP